MKNDLIQARLHRDGTLVSFLNEQAARYADIEADVAPARQQLATSLARAEELTGDALQAPSTGAPREKGSRHAFSRLLRRLVVALQAEATAAKDARLLAMAGQPERLTKLSDTSIVEEGRRLLSLAPERSAALAKRRFTPEHYKQTQALLNELRRHAKEASDGAGTDATGRVALESLLKQNTRTVAHLRTFFRLYEQDEPALWQEFQAAAKVAR